MEVQWQQTPDGSGKNAAGLEIFLLCSHCFATCHSDLGIAVNDRSVKLLIITMLCKNAFMVFGRVTSRTLYSI